MQSKGFKKHLALVNKNNKLKSKSLSEDIKSLKKQIEFLAKEKKSLDINFSERNKVEILKEKLASADEKFLFFKSSIENLNVNIDSAKQRIEEFSSKNKEQEKILESLKDSDFQT